MSDAPDTSPAEPVIVTPEAAAAEIAAMQTAAATHPYRDGAHPQHAAWVDRMLLNYEIQVAGKPLPMPAPLAHLARLEAVQNNPALGDGSHPAHGQALAELGAVTAAMSDGRPLDAVARAAEEALRPLDRVTFDNVAALRDAADPVAAVTGLEQHVAPIVQSAGLAQGEWNGLVMAANELARRPPDAAQLKAWRAANDAELTRRFGERAPAHRKDLERFVEAHAGPEMYGWMVQSGLLESPVAFLQLLSASERWWEGPK